MNNFLSGIQYVVETTRFLIENLFPKPINAMTTKGFELKVAPFVPACSINFLSYQHGLNIYHVIHFQHISGIFTRLDYLIFMQVGS